MTSLSLLLGCDAAEALNRLLSRTTSLFSLSRENPLLSFVVGGIPTVAETRVDSKKDLEIELESAVNRFIASATSALSNPLLQFLVKVERYQQGGGSALSEQPFASADSMRAMAEELRQALQSAMPPLRAKMGLYLGSPVTHGILFTPVKVRTYRLRRSRWWARLWPGSCWRALCVPFCHCLFIVWSM